MKSFFYICLLAGALALPVSERLRSAALQVATVAVTAMEQVLFRGDFAEVRSVDAEDFDETIRESGRLVIVDINHEETSVNQSSKSQLDASIARLPSKVLVAKVLAGRNIELLDELQIKNVPTLRVYRNGELLEEFKGKVDEERFLETVNYHLENPNSKPHRAGYIGPLKKNWLPDGVKERSSDPEMTPLDL